MRKIFQILTVLLVLSISLAISASAAELTGGPLDSEPDREAILAFEEEILRELYYPHGTETEISVAQGKNVDFTKAQKVYVFTPDKFITEAAKEDFADTCAAKGQGLWKIPVEASEECCNYAMIGDGKSGPQGYTTVSGPADTVDSVYYLFYPDEIDAMIEANDAHKITVITVTTLRIDLVMIEMDGDIAFIPYVGPFTGLENGKIYTKDAIIEQIKALIEEQAAAWAAISSKEPEPQWKFGYGHKIVLTAILIAAGQSYFRKRQARKKDTEDT